MYTDQASLLAWLQFSTVDLTYIDDNGLEWNTNASKQTLSSYFNIVEDVAFDKNDKGQNTRKLKIDFNSVLVNKEDNAGESKWSNRCGGSELIIPGFLSVYYSSQTSASFTLTMQSVSSEN